MRSKNFMAADSARSGIMHGSAPRAILGIRGLQITYPARTGSVRAVTDFTLTINEGEFVGLVGESGSGKSTAALAALKLVRRPGRIDGGEIVFEGRDIRAMSDAELRAIRGKDIGLVVQNPRGALNPLVRVGRQIADVVRAHRSVSQDEAMVEAVRALHAVGIPDPKQRARSYPHELSGGMAQRVLIALATVNQPRLLVADEPTTGLDVTVQAQILDVLLTRVRETGSSVLFITHDLGIVAHYCSRVAVMLEGRLIEEASTRDLFKNPRHAYTRRLIDSTASPRRARSGQGIS